MNEMNEAQINVVPTQSGELSLKRFTGVPMYEALCFRLRTHSLIFVGSVRRPRISSASLLIKSASCHTHVGTGWQYRPTVRAGISPIHGIEGIGGRKDGGWGSCGGDRRSNTIKNIKKQFVVKHMNCKNIKKQFVIKNMSCKHIKTQVVVKNSLKHYLTNIQKEPFKNTILNNNLTTHLNNQF